MFNVSGQIMQSKEGQTERERERESGETERGSECVQKHDDAEGENGAAEKRAKARKNRDGVNEKVD